MCAFVRKSQKHFDQKSDLGNPNHLTLFLRKKDGKSVIKLGFLSHLTNFLVCITDSPPIFPYTDLESFTSFGNSICPFGLSDLKSCKKTTFPNF